nr:MAG TPA: hypothetical protein [Bacteriophage sp.]
METGIKWNIYDIDTNEVKDLKTFMGRLQWRIRIAIQYREDKVEIRAKGTKANVSVQGPDKPAYELPGKLMHEINKRYKKEDKEGIAVYTLTIEEADDLLSDICESVYVEIVGKGLRDGIKKIRDKEEREAYIKIIRGLVDNLDKSTGQIDNFVNRLKWYIEDINDAGVLPEIIRRILVFIADAVEEVLQEIDGLRYINRRRVIKTLERLVQ